MKPNWLDTKEYPFQSRYMEINGQSMHFIDEGQGEILLFVHGTPSWSFDFRNVIKQLRANYRCIAIDHIGFGLSDKPYRYNYSTMQHSQSLSEFILKMQLKDITLIVHDFGGPIGLNLVTHQTELFKRIIVLNSWLWNSENDPDFIKMKRILKSPVLPFLYRYLNFSPRFILPAAFGEKKLSKKIRKHYTKPFSNRYQREGALGFARSLLNDQRWFGELWEKRNAWMHLPVLMIWGKKDPVIKTQFLEQFRTGIPHAEVLELEKSGHFPQEEEPETVSSAMDQFIRKNQY